jgi:hypothetical protein
MACPSEAPERPETCTAPRKKQPEQSGSTPIPVVGIFRPGDHPMLNLAAALASAAGQTLSTPAAALDGWLGKVRSGGLAGAAGYVCAATSASKVLLIIDQFEQVFTGCTSPDRRGELPGLLNQIIQENPRQVQIALSVRVDFFGELTLADEPLGGYLQTHAHRLLPFLPHDQCGQGLAFSPDGTRIATASDDGTARIWSIELDEIVRQALTRLPRNLSKDEWRRYMPGVEFRRIRYDLPEYLPNTTV